MKVCTKKLNFKGVAGHTIAAQLDTAQEGAPVVLFYLPTVLPVQKI